MDVATDLRTEITPILGYLELIDEDGAIDEQELRWLASIESRLEGIRRLSDELVALCDQRRGAVRAAAAEGTRTPG